MELVRTGTSYKDANLRVWKMKELIVGPKVGPAEPAYINNPTTGELITNKESIKSTSLAHCVKILARNPIRECDRDELRMKEDNHKLIMGKNKSVHKKDTLDKKLYKEVLKDIKTKNNECSNS